MPPTALTTDAAGNVYVALPTISDIGVYAPGQIEPFRDLNDYGGDPVGVAVANDGTVYVSNIVNTADVAVLSTGSESSGILLAG